MWQLCPLLGPISATRGGNLTFDAESSKKLRVILNFKTSGAIQVLSISRRPSAKFVFTTAVVGLIALCTASFAAEAPAPEIHFGDGRFEPAQLVVPANTPFAVRVTNSDKAAIEFESFELHRERVVRPGETITVFMAPIAPGNYKFVDDLHHDVAEGTILAK